MQKFIIWGGRGHARVIYELLHEQNHQVVCIVDNAVVEPPIMDVPLLHSEQGLSIWLKKNYGNYQGVAAIGTSGQDRLDILDLFCKYNIQTPSVSHLQSFVATTATVLEGTHILAKACICANAYIARGVIINTGSIVEHDVVVDNGAHIAPGVTIAGEVKIGKCCFIGAGTTILPRITIGDNSIIGAGSVVTRDIGPNVVAFGAPAKVMRKL